MKRIKTIKIRTKIILLYISILFISFVMTLGGFAIIKEKSVEAEVGNVAIQTVSALKVNLDSILGNVSQYSNFIYFDSNVQKSLINIDSSSINAMTQQTVQKSLINMLLFGDYISSVFIFDTYDNYYYSYKEGPIFVNKDQIKRAKWYYKVKGCKGKIMYIHGSEDVLSFPTKADINYISLVREISNVDTYEPLAILMINIDEKPIQTYFDSVGKKYNSQFCVIDSENNYIIKPSGYKEEMDAYLLRDIDTTTESKAVIVDNVKMMIAQQPIGIDDWTLVGAFPMDFKGFPASEVYGVWIIIVIFLNLIFIFTCFLALTKLIFNPLNKVQSHMQLVEVGELQEMEIHNQNTDEINNLKRVFNQMIVSIKELIAKVKEEERIIAKHELDIIHAQINPHFLYNTLDAVSALALIEDNKNCLKITQALGNFYRNSLNSGLDLVSIKDEIECIDSYITILNIRYDGKIIVKYDIDEEIKEYKILKLILQPIVENAVHHGIRNKEGDGNISIKAYQDGNEIIFIITDDGLGIKEEKVREILEGKVQKEKSGFGLYSSVQRISLYYNIEKPITITSEEGIGTEITIRVNVIKGVGLSENKSIISR